MHFSRHPGGRAARPFAAVFALLASTRHGRLTRLRFAVFAPPRARVCAGRVANVMGTAAFRAESDGGTGTGTGTGS
jgi:hypothetical protein